MSRDLTITALAMQQAGTRQLLQIAVLRKAHQMQMALADMIDAATGRGPAPAAPGTGRLVDRRA